MLTADGRLLGSSDGAATWHGLSSPFEQKVSVIALSCDGKLYVSSNQGELAVSQDQGATWQALTRPDPDNAIDVLAIDPADGAKVYAAGRTIWASIDGGTSWKTADLSAGHARVTTLALSGGDVVAGLESGEIIRRSDGHWASGGIPRPGAVAALAFDPLGNGTTYAAYRDLVGRSQVYRSNGGGYWEPVAGALPAITINALRIDPADHNRIYLGTSAGLILSLDGGATWELESNDFAANLTQMVVDASDSGTTIHAASAREVYSAAAATKCVYSVSPKSVLVPYEGGIFQIDVSTTSSCKWTVSNGSTWVYVVGPTSGNRIGRYPHQDREEQPARGPTRPTA